MVHQIYQQLNQDEIERKDIRSGDTVLIERSGDVIPKIIKVIRGERPRHSKPFHMPDHCPNCEEPAFKKGDEVNMFLAADGTHLLNVKSEGEVVGQGTGDLKIHLDELKENNIKLYVSGMSAKARGYDESLLNGFNAEFSMPDKLLELSKESDAVLCY